MVELEKDFTLSTLVRGTVLDLSYKEVTSQGHFMVFWLYMSIQSPLWRKQCSSKERTSPGTS